MRSAWRSRRTCEDPSRGGGAAVIEVVVFDAYGTLFDIAAPARRAAAEPGREAFAAVWPQVARDWRLKQLQYSWIRAITGAHADFWQVTQDGLDWALEAAGLAGGAGAARASARALPRARRLSGGAGDARPAQGAGARDRDPVERRRRGCSAAAVESAGHRRAARRACFRSRRPASSSRRRRSTTWSAPSSAPGPTGCSSSRRTAGTRQRRPGTASNRLGEPRGRSRSTGCPGRPRRILPDLTRLPELAATP